MAVSITENCRGCTACFYKCPTGAISGEKGKIHRVEPSLCINCFLCGIICPFGAVIDSSGRPITFIKRSLRPKANLFTGLCRGCTLCRDVCPVSAIKMKPTDFTPFEIPFIDEKVCIGCTLCILICPYEALYLKEGGEKRPTLSMKGIERRQSHRFNFSIDVLFEDSLCIHSATLLNISTDGLFIKTSSPLSVGETIKIAPIYREGVELPEIKGEIIRVKREGEEPISEPAGMGIRFIDIDDDVRKKVEKLIETLKEKG